MHHDLPGALSQVVRIHAAKKQCGSAGSDLRVRGCADKTRVMLLSRPAFNPDIQAYLVLARTTLGR
ncbi:MAG: hypothetical protein D5S03_05460 [Desulfonatronospira sp. MSAO_Bac3]|nr:MAG: hypothetical protein D5S03_05460 [Desulfonatronospira sp. MSAO_Bac3]